jgi:predicted unusual protein kinase regulating ubiquinone biosynthesis (AarF/ABC1/UbiB family)
VSKLAGFLIVIMTDAKLGQWKARMPARANQLRLIIEKLGATYIKIAQAASTRVDLVPPSYLEAFTTLQVGGRR